MGGAGRESLCRGENDEGEILGKCGGSKGKQKTRRAVGLAGRDEGKGVFVLEYFRM